MNGHSVHVRCSRARSTGQIQNENCFRNSFSLFVAQRRLTPLVVSSIHVSRRLMPLLSPSFQPWQLLNCITYSPGIRINVWRESLKGKRKKYSPPLEFRFFFFTFKHFRWISANVCTHGTKKILFSFRAVGVHTRTGCKKGERIYAKIYVLWMELNKLNLKKHAFLQFRVYLISFSKVCKYSQL